MKRIFIGLLAVVMLCACQKSEQRNTYFRLEQGSLDLRFEFFGGSQSYVVYSDYERWNFVVNYDMPVETEWVKVWPFECEADSRFSLKVFPNDSGESRTASVDIVVGGRILQTIRIEQGGAE